MDSETSPVVLSSEVSSNLPTENQGNQSHRSSRPNHSHNYGHSSNHSSYRSSNRGNGRESRNRGGRGNGNGGGSSARGENNTEHDQKPHGEDREPVRSQHTRNGDRNNRGARNDRGARNERGNQSNREERNDHGDQNELYDRGEQTDRNGRNHRGQRKDRNDRNDQSELNDQGDQNHRSEPNDRGEPNDHDEQNNRSDRSNRNERNDRSGRGDRNDRSDRGDRSERSDRGDRGERYRGSRGNYNNGYRGNPRGPRGTLEEAPKSNTLVIKNEDNEFLRMLKQTKQKENSRGKKSGRDDDTSSDPMGEDAVQRRVGHSRARQFQSLPQFQQSSGGKPRSSTSESRGAHKACPVCLMDSPSLTGELVQAITSCEHIYCFECALRLIFITDKSDCPICRQTLTKVVLTRSENLEEAGTALKDFLLPNASKDPAVAQNTTSKTFKNFAKMVYYDGAEGSDIFDLIKRLLWFNCPFCPSSDEYSYKMTTKNASAYEAITRHLGRRHNREFCDLCFFNLELFPYEYDFYTRYEMEQHKRQGSLVGDATVQHRMCHLCSEPGYYFNNDALATHCKEAHISCYVCNSQTIFFIDQPSLVEHVVQQHICCPECQQTSGQVIGFLSVIELKSHAHVEHPSAKIDYEGLAKKHIANASAVSGSASFGHFDLNESLVSETDSNMSRREAFDEIDNLLRNRFSAERHRSAPSFNPKTENYLMNFPQIDTMGNSGSIGASSGGGSNGSAGPNTTGNGKQITNVNLFPGSKYRVMGGKINSHDYEQEFPGLGPKASSGLTSAKQKTAPSTIAATAANMKHKPQNWQAPSVPSAASQFLKTPVDLSNKKAAEISKKLKTRKISNTDPDEEPHSIYDDMIFTNPLEAPQTVGISKPASIRLIEAIPTQSSQKVPQKKGPPPIEAFPALGRPAPAAPSGANWSKAMASKPTAKQPNAKANGKGQPKQIKPAPSIDLQDGSSFPTLLSSGDNVARPNGFGPPAPSGPRWASEASSSASGLRKNKRKNKASAVENNEWMRPGDETDNVVESSKNVENNNLPSTSTLTDPYITHHATGDRNNTLRSKVRLQLQSLAKGNDNNASEAFASFKELTLSYRNGQIAADYFFEVGRNLLGADFFDTIIADLISLLPSIAKQNQLYSRLLQDSRLKNSRSAVLWKCTECSQLVIPAEKTEHQRCHTKSGRR